MFETTDKEQLEKLSVYVRDRVSELTQSCNRIESLIEDERFKEVSEEVKTVLEIERKVWKAELHVLLNVQIKL